MQKATRMLDLNFAVTKWQIKLDCHDWGFKQQPECDVEALERGEGISLAVVEEGQSRIFLLSSHQWWLLAGASEMQQWSATKERRSAVRQKKKK